MTAGELHRWGIQWISPNLWNVWCSKENYHHLGNWRTYESAEKQLNTHLSSCVVPAEPRYLETLDEEERTGY